MAKTKSKRWSMKDIRAIKNFIKTAEDAGGNETDGLKNAAKYFGVTLNSVMLRWRRFKVGIHTEGLAGNTTKTPMIRKKRKYTKRKLQAIQTSAIEEVESFSQKQSMTRELRKMVIDLMNTSGHIKAVSVDLSNKSFTVIF